MIVGVSVHIDELLCVCPIAPLLDMGTGEGQIVMRLSCPQCGASVEAKGIPVIVTRRYEPELGVPLHTKPKLKLIDLGSADLEDVDDGSKGNA